jgi:hypothetical protein
MIGAQFVVSAFRDGRGIQRQRNRGQRHHRRTCNTAQRKGVRRQKKRRRCRQHNNACIPKKVEKNFIGTLRNGKGRGTFQLEDVFISSKNCAAAGVSVGSPSPLLARRCSEPSSAAAAAAALLPCGCGRGVVEAAAALALALAAADGVVADAAAAEEVEAEGVVSGRRSESAMNAA